MFMLRSGQCPFPLLSPPHLSPPRQRLPKISSIFLPLQHPQPSHHMQLPIEIFEAVIDQARDNSASLRNLALTCATFLPRSRYHLFSSIIIQPLEVSITLTAPEFPLRSVGRVSETAVAAIFAHTYVL